MPAFDLFANVKPETVEVWLIPGPDFSRPARVRCSVTPFLAVKRTTRMVVLLSQASASELLGLTDKEQSQLRSWGWLNRDDGSMVYTLESAAKRVSDVGVRHVLAESAMVSPLRRLASCLEADLTAFWHESSPNT